MYLATVNGKVQRICTLALLNLNQRTEVDFQIKLFVEANAAC